MPDSSTDKQAVVDLLSFISRCSTQFHAARESMSILEASAAPFAPLDIGGKWSLKPGDRRFVELNSSAVMAIIVGNENPASAGFRIVAAHTDSPSFRIKPKPEMESEGFVKLNTEVYGGPILSTWLDRPLGLAGRVSLRGNGSMKPSNVLVDLGETRVVIPNQAIHMNRNVNDGVKLAKQKDMLPVLGLVPGNSADKTEKLKLADLVAARLSVKQEDILDFDLFLFDPTPGEFVGCRGEMIAAPRLDDLAMVHAGLLSIKDAPTAAHTSVLLLFDSEEIGSRTKSGADSPFFSMAFERICLSLGLGREDYFRALSRSFMISADMAHAIHPNVTDKFDPTHRARLNGGPAIKVSASGSYMTDADSAAVFEALGRDCSIQVQRFVNNSDEAGGSTIGPISTTQMPMRTVDVGNPMLSMHSIRETAGALDHQMMIAIMKRFFSTE